MYADVACPWMYTPTLQNDQPDHQPDYQLRADSSTYQPDSSMYQADTVVRTTSPLASDSVGPGG